MFENFQIGGYACEAYTTSQCITLFVFKGMIREYDKQFPLGTPLEEIKVHATQWINEHPL